MVFPRIKIRVFSCENQQARLLRVFKRLVFFSLWRNPGNAPQIPNADFRKTTTTSLLSPLVDYEIVLCSSSLQYSSFLQKPIIFFPNTIIFYNYGENKTSSETGSKPRNNPDPFLVSRLILHSMLEPTHVFLLLNST